MGSSSAPLTRVQDTYRSWHYDDDYANLEFNTCGKLELWLLHPIEGGGEVGPRSGIAWGLWLPDMDTWNTGGLAQRLSGGRVIVGHRRLREDLVRYLRKTWQKVLDSRVDV